MPALTAGKWHGSFKSDDAMLMLAVTSAVQKAGGECTVVHDAQRNATWGPTWTAKCIKAIGVIVLYTDAYRANFTEALKLEAAVILALWKAGSVKLFILDPSDGNNASNVRSNIMDDAAGMGDIDAWVSFITENGVVENAEVAATAAMTNVSLGGSGGGGAQPRRRAALRSGRAQEAEHARGVRVQVLGCAAAAAVPRLPPVRDHGQRRIHREA